MPENVRDRDELLLNAIVTGDTSGIDPRDREEKFIKAIAESNHLKTVSGSLNIQATGPITYSFLQYEGAFTITLTDDGKIREFLSSFDFSTLDYILASRSDTSQSLSGKVINAVQNPNGTKYIYPCSYNNGYIEIGSTGMDITLLS